MATTNPFQMLKMLSNPAGAMQEQLLARLWQKNPAMYDEIVRNLKGKSDTELKNMAQNIARERGIDIDDFIRGLGLKPK